MQRLEIKDLNSIINTLDEERKNTEAILTEQSSTLFHSFDYYRGQLDTLDRVLTILKLHSEISKKGE